MSDGLEVVDLFASYRKQPVLHGVSFTVPIGSVSVLLGNNGAGKTTTLRAVTGLLRCTGTVRYRGHDLSRATPSTIVRAGIAHVPQGRGTFIEQTVARNLLLGAYTQRDRKALGEDFERMYELFPRLAERRNQPAGNLSGGEQQMLAIARALMMRPTMLLLDEPTLGLAPAVVDSLFDLLARLKREFDVTMLVVEQNVEMALELADSAFVLENGVVSMSGTPAQIGADSSVQRLFLGV